MRNSHFPNRFRFLSWHIFPHKPMNFLVKSLEIWSNRFFFHLFIIIFSMFFSYLHKQFSSFLPCFPHVSPFSLGFPHFSPFSPGFPQVFPRFSPPFRSLPVVSPASPCCATRHLQGLAEESKRRIEATGWAWHQVLNVAKEATLQEVKQLGEGQNLWLIIYEISDQCIMDVKDHYLSLSIGRVIRHGGEAAWWRIELSISL